MKLCKLTFKSQGITVQVPKGTTIMEAINENNFQIDAFCNGKGECGKCLIKLKGIANEPTEYETRLLESKIKEGYRLACRTKILGDAEVTFTEKSQLNSLKDGKTMNYEFNPSCLDRTNFKSKAYGLAVDIGTTSLVISLNDLLNEGKEIDTISALNPQTRHGGDVITRINYAHESQANLEKLNQLVIKGINELIDQLCKRNHIMEDDIAHIVFAGNTIMLHLLAGVDPISLGIAPYNMVFSEYKRLTSSEIKVRGGSKTSYSLLPSLSAFVGSDILAGMIATGFHQLGGASLFIDIGTNGEIVANINGKLVATSSAAGPALEGMNIEYGCRAEDGAISRVEIMEDGLISISTINDKKPIGICGSGLVDLVSELLKFSVVTQSGSFAEIDEMPETLRKNIIEYKGRNAFVVDSESNIVITQRDIREVQLAKGAMAAAIIILFKYLEVDISSVKNVYIAGAFGYHLDAQALINIGLLPATFITSTIEFVGNTSKEGTRLCLISKNALEEINRLKTTIEPVELSFVREFQDIFVENMEFLHTENIVKESI